MSNYEISKSSLLSLKAEILRKQEEVKTKVHENVKKKTPLISKNKGVEKRSENDTVEDMDLLEKSRIALEKKARLYDELSKSKITDDDPASMQNRFLVRFNDKDREDEDVSPHDYDDAENSDEEWVEYIDCLGRSRTCLKKDLERFKSRDKDYKRVETESDMQIKNKDEINDPSITPEKKELLSDDMRRDFQRQQWEKEEYELQDKNEIHYQDVLFSEARTHGVGYYSFSKDEEVRKQQQRSLEKLRTETQEEQKKSQELKAMREQQLAARIKAAKMRKRARLGLPPEEEEEQEEEKEIGPLPPETIEDPKTDPQDALKETLLEEARRNHIRPWDMGKEKVPEFYEYTQEEWVEKQRKQRLEEFAPPKTYRRDFRAEPSKLEFSEPKRYLSFSTKKMKIDGNRGINPYKKCDEDLEDPFDEETRTFNPYKLSKSFNKTNIEKYNDSNENEAQRNIGNEPEGGVSHNNPSENIEASIEAGLKYLRGQVEKTDYNINSDNCY